MLDNPTPLAFMIFASSRAHILSLSSLRLCPAVNVDAKTTPRVSCIQHDVLRDLIGVFVTVYLDSTVVFSNNRLSITMHALIAGAYNCSCWGAEKPASAAASLLQHPHPLQNVQHRTPCTMCHTPPPAECATVLLITLNSLRAHVQEWTHLRSACFSAESTHRMLLSCSCFGCPAQRSVWI